MIFYSGYGWLSLVLFVFTPVLALVVGAKADGLGGTVAIVVVNLIGASINHALALRLNSAVGSDGRRRWNDDHTVYGLSMQGWTIAILLVALGELAAWIGVQTDNELLGWLVFLVTSIGALAGQLVYRRRADRRRPGSSPPPSRGQAPAFDDLAAGFFGGGPQAAPGVGKDLQVGLDIGRAEAAAGAVRDLRVATATTCGTCGGTGAAPGTAVATCQRCGGSGKLEGDQRSPFGWAVGGLPCEHCHGAGTLVPQPCRACEGWGRVRTERTVNCRIPSGVEDGVRLRFAGLGEAGIRGRPAGDLYVLLQMRADRTGADGR
jgi:DnaJ central domain/DnaJ C terminal domain